MMRTVRLPSGEQVAAIGQGTWYMGDRKSEAAREVAALQLGIDLGMTLIDTALPDGGTRHSSSVRFIRKTRPAAGCRQRASAA
jgi:hypothetical protein